MTVAEAAFARCRFRPPLFDHHIEERKETNNASACGGEGEQRGVMQAGEGLHPTSKAKRVRFSGAQRTVIDGPFAETKELIAGFWLWKVKDMNDAVAWLKKAPFDGGTEVEIRPIFEAEDFGKELTPELRQQEERLRELSKANR